MHRVKQTFYISLLFVFFIVQTSKSQVFHVNTINCKISSEDMALLNRMGKFEAMFYNQVFGTQKNDTVSININLYGKRSEYNSVQKEAMHTTFIDGFYSPMQNKIFMYKTDEYMKTLFHETSHNILRYNYPNPPQWLNEGIATLLGYLVETTDNRVLYVPQSQYVRRVKEGIRNGKFTFNDFFAYKNSDWFDEDKRPMLYAASYSIIYFLVNQDKDYLGQILVLMKKGASTYNAFKTAFGSADEFEKQFRIFYTSGPGINL